MQLQNVEREDLQKISTQLDQALYNHQQWHNELLRTLVCRLPYDKHDTSAKAHKECRFGQWYYNGAPAKIKNHPSFLAIGEAHHHMHQAAQNLLEKVETSNSVSTYDYDNFANVLERLRLEIYTFKNELEVLLFNRDPLTMAVNRINMLPVLREVQELAKRQFQPVCIAMLDFDLFKNANDKYGHQAGDKILAAVAHYLIEHLRPYDKLFRYGGEEFLVCTQQVDLPTAFKMIDRLRKEIEVLPIDIGVEKPIHITVSIGLTTLDSNATIEQSIDHADKALYMAKSAGRNCVKIWGEEK